jgi:hypothetical protein
VPHLARVKYPALGEGSLSCTSVLSLLIYSLEVRGFALPVGHGNQNGPERLRKGGGGLHAPATVLPAPQLLRHCAPQYPILMSSASRQTETQEKQEEPDHDAEGYEYGSGNSYVRGSPDEQLFLWASAH